MKRKLLLILMLCLFIPLTACQKPKTNIIKNKAIFDKINYQNIDKLMVVAHPDDETIWGGAHMLQGHYLVVCITNGYNKARKKEFEKACKISNNPCVILDYPDKINGKKSDWKDVWDYITNDMQYLLNKKNFKQIVTHNPDGEYGHQHHKYISRIMTDLAKKDKITDKLVYFGIYYKKRILPPNMKRISDQDLAIKVQMTKEYKTQALVMEHLGHMFPYENWIEYKDWR